MIILGIFGGIYWFLNRPIPFCATGELENPGVCIRCPNLGMCEANSFHCNCPPGFIISKDRKHCIEDTGIPILADKLMNNVLKPALRRRKGDYFCGIASSNKMNENEVDALLHLEYSKLAPSDSLFNDYYLVLRHLISISSLHQISREMVSKTFYWSSNEDPILTISCWFYIQWMEYKYFIILAFLISIVIGFQFCVYFKKKSVLEDILLRLERQYEIDPAVPGVSIYSLRDEFCKHRNSKFSFNYWVWKAVENDVAHDSRIDKTSQLVNHEQKVMWEFVP